MLSWQNHRLFFIRRGVLLIAESKDTVQSLRIDSQATKSSFD